MIEFVTLLLGLVTGVQAVELAVDDRVALVELRLDGEFAGGLVRPPWLVECDFGDALAPHELEAIAYDGQRREIARSRQWVNLPRQRVEARLALERAGESNVARLIWTALDDPGPREIRLTFDGQPLAVDDPEAEALPAHDPGSLHFLRAELELANAERAYAELVFGGTYGEAISTELTALVLIAERRRAPRPEQMAGWLEKRGEPLRVVAVERGPANLIVVRERSAATRDGLLRVAAQHRRQRSGARARLAQLPVVGERDRVRFVYPTADRAPKSVGHGLATLDVEQVPVSRDVEIVVRRPVRPGFRPAGEPPPVPAAGYRSLLAALTDFSHEDAPEPVHQLADAVAIAGVVAAAGDRRRTVLLIRSGQLSDDSRFAPATVRQYLAKLGVPLTVWSVPAADAGPSPWGDERDVSELRAMNRALDDLRRALESQIVVWVEGAHLPHEIELTARAEGLRRAG